MKLTPEQIEQLFAFTRQHFVEYYDLQLELIDHLANAIEQKWQENPKLTFDEALNTEFKKFGVFGFSDVIEKKQAAMSKIYNRFIWQNVKEFFTFVNTIVAFLVVFLLFQLFSLQNAYDYFLVLIGTIFFIITIYAIYTSKKTMKLKKKQTDRKWLLEEIIMRHNNLFLLFNIMFQILLRIENVENVYLGLAITCLFGLIGIYLYVIIVKIPQKANEYLASTYPEYKLENL